MLSAHVKAVEGLIGELHTTQDHLKEVAGVTFMAWPKNITEFFGVNKNV